MPRSDGYKNLIPAKKGEPSRNPKGRPIELGPIVLKNCKKITPKTIIDQLKKIGINPTEKDLLSVMIYLLSMKGILGQALPLVDVQAIREYLDRGFGKASQPIEHSGSMELSILDRIKQHSERMEKIKSRENTG